MRDDVLLDPRRLSTLPDAVLLDARSGPDARARFEASHLAGARHADLDLDLAAKVGDASQGGRHPLPTAREFAARVASWGLGPATPVVVYDDKGGANAAARAWWMLRALGVVDVRVLDGGLDAAIEAGAPLESGPAPSVPAAPGWDAPAWRWPIADLEDVARAAHDPSWVVLDARDPSRYAGVADPFDPRPGHIPGAKNAPFARHLDGRGRFVSDDALAALYAPLLAGRDGARVIATCGSGVTACHTLLALECLGVRGAALYVGSFSEWTRRGRPVDTV